MIAWPTWLQGTRRGPVSPGIDLGNGQVMAAEDVLEGHFRRVAARRQATAYQTATHAATHQASLQGFTHAGGMQQVTVQVGDNLVAAIAVLAPELVPLTNVAENVSTALPLVQPAPKFRANLQEALERTHRQHAAQRVLGTRPPARVARRVSTPIWGMTIVAIMAVIGALYFWWNRRSHHQPV